MRLLIWGIGSLIWEVVDRISEDNVIGYIDTYASKKKFAGKPLYKPEEVKCLDYDAILVSTIWSKEIAQTCKELGISLHNVIFIYGNIQTADMNQDYEFVESVCGKKFADFIKKRYHLVSEIEINLDEDKKDFEIADYLDNKYYEDMYIRLKTFELLVDEIKQGVKGQIAELGVFKGDFAQFLNAAFPDRKLYLFDTFESFDKKELERSLKKKETSTILATREVYANTSVQVVMDKMKYEENVIIKQGYFPDSLGEGLDEDFAFVSLDCDVEESLYQGLVYFYPRLVKGGYIMVHDYNNFIGDNAKRAIKRYENDIHMSLAKVPICDTQGSLIITK